MIKKLFCALLIGAVLTSCEKETRELKEIEDVRIQEYLTQNNLTSQFTKDSLGLYIQVLNEGEGELLKNSDKVFFLADITELGGKKINSFSGLITTSNAFQFMPNLSASYTKGGYIGYIQPKGIREVLLKAKRGEKVRALIPSEFGYGKNGNGVYVGGNVILDATFEILKTDNQKDAEDSLINKYLKKTGSNGFIKDTSGVYYKILAEGTGDTIATTTSLKTVYTGKFLDGKTFDSSTKEKPFETTLASVITAWGYVVPKIKKGGKIQFVLPSYLGYGTSGSGSILYNTPLFFEVEVLKE